MSFEICSKHLCIVYKKVIMHARVIPRGWGLSGKFQTRTKKQRQAARTPSVVFVVASHYQSLQIDSKASHNFFEFFQTSTNVSITR